MDGHGMDVALPMAASQLNLRVPRHRPVLLPLPRVSEGVGLDIMLIGQLVGKPLGRPPSTSRRESLSTATKAKAAHPQDCPDG